MKIEVAVPSSATPKQKGDLLRKTGRYGPRLNSTLVIPNVSMLKWKAIQAKCKRPLSTLNKALAAYKEYNQQYDIWRAEKAIEKAHVLFSALDKDRETQSVN